MAPRRSAAPGRVGAPAGRERAAAAVGRGPAAPLRGRPAVSMPRPATALGWMALQTRALFVHDARGRLVARNEPGAPPPPRLFLGRTRCGALWRLGAQLPEALARELSRLAAAEWRVPDPARPPERLAVLRARLEAEAPVEEVWSGPAFCFPERLSRLAAPLPEGAEAVVLGAEARARAALRFAHVRDLEGRPPVVGVFAEGELASVCFAATGPGPAVEAGMETLAAQRGRGFARAAVAAWARAVRAEGREPLYSTSETNRASRALAERLGLIPYGWDLHLR